MTQLRAPQLVEPKTFSAFKGSLIEAELKDYIAFIKDMKSKTKDKEALALLDNVKKIVKWVKEQLARFDKGKSLSNSDLLAIITSYGWLYINSIAPLIEQFKKFHINEKHDDKSKILTGRIYYQLFVKACASIENWPKTITEFAPFLNLELVIKKILKAAKIFDFDYNQSARSTVSFTNAYLQEILALSPQIQKIYDTFVKSDQDPVAAAKAISETLNELLPLARELPALLSIHETHKKIRATDDITVLNGLHEIAEENIKVIEDELSFFSVCNRTTKKDVKNMLEYTESMIALHADSCFHDMHFLKALYLSQQRTIEREIEQNKSLATNPKKQNFRSTSANYSKYETSVAFQLIKVLRDALNTSTIGLQDQPHIDYFRHILTMILNASEMIAKLFDQGKVPSQIQLRRIIYLSGIINSYSKLLYMHFSVNRKFSDNTLFKVYSDLTFAAMNYIINAEFPRPFVITKIMPFLNLKEALPPIINALLPLINAISFSPDKLHGVNDTFLFLPSNAVTKIIKALDSKNAADEIVKCLLELSSDTTTLSAWDFSPKTMMFYRYAIKQREIFANKDNLSSKDYINKHKEFYLELTALRSKTNFLPFFKVMIDYLCDTSYKAINPTIMNITLYSPETNLFRSTSTTPSHTNTAAPSSKQQPKL